jgi:hypothetical protein
MSSCVSVSGCALAGLRVSIKSDNLTSDMHWLHYYILLVSHVPNMQLLEFESHGSRCKQRSAPLCSIS